jgi:hypothetical protein
LPTCPLCRLDFGSTRLLVTLKASGTCVADVPSLSLDSGLTCRLVRPQSLRHLRRRRAAPASLEVPMLGEAQTLSR